MLFLSIISTAYHLLSGSRAERLLLNWLIDWLIEFNLVRCHCQSRTTRRRYCACCRAVSTGSSLLTGSAPDAASWRRLARTRARPGASRCPAGRTRRETGPGSSTDAPRARTPSLAAVAGTRTPLRDTLCPWHAPWMHRTTSGQIVKSEQGERFPLLYPFPSLPFPFSLSFPSPPSSRSFSPPLPPLEVGYLKSS